MTGSPRSVLRFAVSRPGVVFLIALAGFATVLASSDTEPWVMPLLGVCLPLTYLAAVQGLRVSWHSSRARAFLLAALLALVGAPWWGKSPLVAVLLWSPLAVAVLLELVLPKLRASRGPLWLDGPDGPKAAEARPAAAGRPGFWRRNRSGCLFGLGLLTVVLAAFLWQVTTPGRHAAAAQARLVPGMSVAEIVGAAESPYMCTIAAPGNRVTGEGPPLYRIWADRSGYWLTVGDGRSRKLTRDGLVGELGGAPLSPYRRVSFTFRSSSLPLSVSFTVTLDDSGRLKEVGPSRAWD
jgi:hypothetical protein